MGVARSRPAYVYVPHEQVDSIMKHGYLGVRRQLQMEARGDPAFEGTSDRIQAKYQTQFEQARRKYPEANLGSILEYLDWREETTCRGADAVYFLYTPVPIASDIRQRISEQRGDFLDGKVLLRLDIGDEPEYAIGDDEAREYVHTEWLQIWRCALNEDKGKDNMWFDGIPHAMVVPESGGISPDKIHTV